MTKTTQQATVTLTTEELARRLYALGAGPELCRVTALERYASPADLARLRTAMRNCMGGGVQWLWALESAGFARPL